MSEGGMSMADNRNYYVDAGTGGIVYYDEDPYTPKSQGGAGEDNPADAAVTTPNATQMAAEILRSQYDDRVSTYKPIELAARDQVSFMNPAILPEAVSKAGTLATNQANTSAGIIDRTNRSMGVKPTGEQSQVSSRIMNLSRAAQIASAENTARENVRTQDEQILLGTTPNPNIVKSYNT